ncbi:MAG: HPF/RaiA family ribosome-associated protein [Candidatus Rokuibacteriota bacterium]
MLTEILGLRGQRRLRVEVAKQLRGLLGRRRIAPVSVRVAFFDDDGPRGGVAIRCALTVKPKRGPVIRVEHTARSHFAAFNGRLAILKRQLKRRVERGRRRTRYPTSRTPGVGRRRRQRDRSQHGPDERDDTDVYRSTPSKHPAQTLRWRVVHAGH